MQKLARRSLSLIGAVLVATACSTTWHEGTGAMPSVDDVDCTFDNSEAPEEPLPPSVAAVIEWGGYEAYGGFWISSDFTPRFEGDLEPLTVGIVGDAEAFDNWLDAEPTRREAAGISDVAAAKTPYCIIMRSYGLLATVPGILMGGVSVNGGDPIVEVVVETMDTIDLSDYPPFMRFREKSDDIVFDTIPLEL
ncbi:MAG: hypothetical protein ACN4GK_02765 [Acidimicrobiia bacterium]